MIPWEGRNGLRLGLGILTLILGVDGSSLVAYSFSSKGLSVSVSLVIVAGGTVIPSPAGWNPYLLAPYSTTLVLPLSST